MAGGSDLFKLRHIGDEQRGTAYGHLRGIGRRGRGQLHVGGDPVSYTHLDVYKRQAVEHLNAGMQSNVKGFGLYPGKSHYINGTYFE